MILPAVSNRFIQAATLGCLLFAVGCGGGGAGTPPSSGTGGVPPASPLEVQLVAGAFGPSAVGSADGAAALARFNWITGIVCDSAGNSYIVDSSNNIIRKLTAQGTVTTLAGSIGVQGHVDGAATSARFSLPLGITIDAGGNLYVSESGNNAIRKITPVGQVSTLAGGNGAGSQDGLGAAARFNKPSGLAIDPSGTLFVADENNHTVRKITADGTVSTLAGVANELGSADGAGTGARFSFPKALALGPSGALFVADSRAFTIRRISPEGMVSTLAGSPYVYGDSDGQGAAARFCTLAGLACDSTETLFATTDSGTVRKITRDGLVSTLTGKAHIYGHRDGSSAVAGFVMPGPIAFNGAGNFLVGDQACIRKINIAGDVLTVAGAASRQGSWDGRGSEARFTSPLHLAMNASGDLFVSEAINTIRRIDPSGMVTTVAGTPGWSGFQDGPGAEAVFNFPSALAFSPSGDLFIADSGNSVIRKMAPNGQVSLFAGSPMQTGNVDGICDNARFFGPSGLVTDPSGTIYVADRRNHTLRRITAAGLVSTWAGVPGIQGHSDGPLASATFDSPGTLQRDNVGNTYCADLAAGTIRKVSAAGVVTSIGSGLKLTGALAVDNAGNLYVACTGPRAIKKIDSVGQVSVILAQSMVDALSPGTFPSSVLSIRGLLVASNSLLLLADDSVLRASPIP